MMKSAYVKIAPQFDIYIVQYDVYPVFGLHFLWVQGGDLESILPPSSLS